jgi:hypothetical protein
MDDPKAPNFNLDASTAALLSTLPNIPLRDRLFDTYVKRKTDWGDEGFVTASLLTSGDWFAHISEVLEFTETSTGAF